MFPLSDIDIFTVVVQTSALRQVFISVTLNTIPNRNTPYSLWSIMQ